VGRARPPGTPQIIPYLYYPDATKALEFLVDAFGFEVIHAVRDDEGVVWTAQLRLGDGVVMIGPGMDGFGTRAVVDAEWATTRMFTFVEDIDAHHERARAAGARILSEPAIHFGGNKQYVASDCGGQQWIFAEPADETASGTGREAGPERR
jgi:uncharacterized glyoxalase superfamily protein PhnB